MATEKLRGNERLTQDQQIELESSGVADAALHVAAAIIEGEFSFIAREARLAPEVQGYDYYGAQAFARMDAVIRSLNRHDSVI